VYQKIERAKKSTSLPSFAEVPKTHPKTLRGTRNRYPKSSCPILTHRSNYTSTECIVVGVAGGTEAVVVVVVAAGAVAVAEDTASGCTDPSCLAGH
jgi:hypothetical protein